MSNCYGQVKCVTVTFLSRNEYPEYNFMGNVGTMMSYRGIEEGQSVNVGTMMSYRGIGEGQCLSDARWCRIVVSRKGRM